MTHIFRLQGQTNGIDTLEDWTDSQAYSTNVIDAISEPDGANTKKEITSIPSPFARIDLVKTAFKIVAASGNLDGQTIYHKMVSDTLDVAQIFFNYQKLRDKFEIVEWNKERDLQQLAGNPSNIDKTLNTYLQSDGSTYHFDKMQSIYILKYIGPDSNKVPNDGIIGATSPATLFFSTANKLAENGILSQNVRFVQDKPFDNDFCPLYKRDFEFVKYLYALRHSYREFASIFGEVNQYLDVTRRQLSNEQDKAIKEEIENDANFNIDDKYNRLQFGEAGVVEILQGVHFHVRPTIKPHSDFEILSDKCQGDKPFVLPVVNGAIYANFKYVTDEWGSENKAPFSDNSDIASRHLPFDGTQYPYLTISDFLEEKIIKLSNEINTTDFFDGNLQSASESTYLLPIKPLYFKYFDIEKLTGEVARGKKSIEMRELAGGGVKVTLRIPVKGTDSQRYVEYSRDYDRIASTGNDGKVEFFDNVAFGLYPNAAFNADSEAFYRFAITSKFDAIDKFNLHCYQASQTVESTEVVRNVNVNAMERCQTFAVEGHRVDYLQIESINENARGLVVPKFRNSGGTDNFTFAIDLGTSNTHIEYSVNNSRISKEFDITDTDRQFVTLTKEVFPRHHTLFMQDFIPFTIGQQSEVSFPVRTALSAGKQTNWSAPVLPMAHANMALTYLKYDNRQYNDIFTNIKWSNDTNSISQLRAYIESLMLMLRSKVVMNNGNLQSTRIVWFYPISMTVFKVNQLERIWRDVYQKYFGGAASNVARMTESVAPYEFYKAELGGAEIVTIDIGGGTSDVVIANGNDVKYITSFRFAANNIFSNYLDASLGKMNGVVRYFGAKIADIIQRNGLNGQVQIYNSLLERKNSEELASYFFTLSNYQRSGQTVNFDTLNLSNMISVDDKQKIIFVLFYAAIIYHVACIMKAKGEDMPRFIAFSGNGSKVLQSLTDNDKLMAEYAKKIFEKVYETPYTAPLEVKRSTNQPKEATCKGGILCEPQTLDNYDSTVNSKKLILRANDMKSFASDADLYSNIDDAYIAKVAQQVVRFVDAFFDINRKFKYADNFGVETSIINVANEVCRVDIERYIKDMLELRRKQIGDDQPVEETLFFYAISGIMFHLSDRISDDAGCSALPHIG